MLTLFGCFQLFVRLNSAFANKMKNVKIIVIFTWTSDFYAWTSKSLNLLVLRTSASKS